MSVSKEHIQKVISVLLAEGKDAVLKQFNVPEETFKRYLRLARQYGISTVDKGKLISQIIQNYNEAELEAIAKGGRVVPGYAKVPIISFEGERIRIGAITDTHIGSVDFHEERLYQAFDEFHKEKVDFIAHAGDVLEGMSNRPGHIYELTHLGYDNQKTYAIQCLSQWKDTPIYAISGNHDRWYIKSSGANVLGDIDKELENFHFLGHDEGEISLKGKAVLRLFHGEDSSSYALSYRIQKIIESLTGGQKPNAMIFGHVHKYVDIFERHVHCTSIGCLQSQTRWMRSKRIAAHPGFAIIDYWVNNQGICQKTICWKPFYS
jgi:predicted phosphodiesterase